MHKIDME